MKPKKFRFSWTIFAETEADACREMDSTIIAGIAPEDFNIDEIPLEQWEEKAVKNENANRR